MTISSAALSTASPSSVTPASSTPVPRTLAQLKRAIQNRRYRAAHDAELHSPEAKAHRAALARARYVRTWRILPCETEGCTGRFIRTGRNNRRRFCLNCSAFYYPSERRTKIKEKI